MRRKILTKNMRGGQNLPSLSSARVKGSQKRIVLLRLSMNFKPCSDCHFRDIESFTLWPYSVPHSVQRGVGETGGNSNTFCFGSSGTETILDIRLLFTCVQTLAIWLYSSCKNIWKCEHQVVEIRLRKKWLPMLQSTPDARSIVTAARDNCNVLKNNVMISTVIFKNVNCRYGRITCSLTDSCGLEKIQVYFARGLLNMSIPLIIKLK